MGSVLGGGVKGLPKMNMNSGYMAGEAFGRGKAFVLWTSQGWPGV